jgi:hypothetical protein
LCDFDAEPEHFAENSRFGKFNSRFGRRQFPVRAAAGIRSQRLDLPYPCYGQTAVTRGKSMKFPVSTGKTGNSASIAERLAVQPPDNGRAAIS